MKKVLFPLALLLVLSLIPSAALAEDSTAGVFALEIEDGAEYDGFLVRVEDSSEPALSPLGDADYVAEGLYTVDTLAQAESLWDEESIAYIEPNYVVTLDSAPNDAYYSAQWSLPFIGAEAVWDAGITANGVSIAVIDSGLVPGHEDIDYSYIAPGYNFLGDNADVTDIDGHGSHIIGQLAAVRNNGLGIAGLLDEVIIVPLKTFEQGESLVADVVQAIRAAVDTYHCDVIHMSFGIEHSSAALAEAVAYADANNVLMVASAGNEGEEPERHDYRYPAAYEQVIGVGALDETGTVASYSQRNDSVLVTAPGTRIVSLSHKDTSGYAYNDGTSFSSPYVTAMAAVARATVHDMTGAEFKQLLADTAVDLGDPGYDTDYGYGAIDMAAFLAALPETNWVAGFRDITYHWGRDSIQYVVELGLFNGTTSYTFEPDTEMSRAMFVTVLGRLYEEMGGEIPDQSDGFTDTVPNTWYSKYVAWAAENDIVAGHGDGRFGPGEPVSREQAATIMYRYADQLGLDVEGDTDTLGGFTDTGSVSTYALDPLAWCVDKGIITGIADGDSRALEPTGASTRAQVATILERFVSVSSLAAVA